MHANFRDDGFTDKGIKFILSSLADVDFPALTFLDLAGSFASLIVKVLQTLSFCSVCVSQRHH